jgi:hypothetical protein
VPVIETKTPDPAKKTLGEIAEKVAEQLLELDSMD